MTVTHAKQHGQQGYLNSHGHASGTVPAVRISLLLLKPFLASSKQMEGGSSILLAFATYYQQVACAVMPSTSLLQLLLKGCVAFALLTAGRYADLRAN